jgi:hypothetical protein
LLPFSPIFGRVVNMVARYFDLTLPSPRGNQAELDTKCACAFVADGLLGTPCVTSQLLSQSFCS